MLVSNTAILNVVALGKVVVGSVREGHNTYLVESEQIGNNL